MRRNGNGPHPVSPRAENCIGIRGGFRVCATWIANAAGTPWAFALAVFVIAGWGMTGPIFHYSDTWQLVINTATTIVTFLIVFLIQNTQNRDTKAMHLKMDELLRAIGNARTTLVNPENFSDQELDQLQKEFERISKLAQRRNRLQAADNTKKQAV